MHSQQRVRTLVGARSSTVLNRMTALELCVKGDIALNAMEELVSRVLDRQPRRGNFMPASPA